MPDLTGPTPSMSETGPTPEAYEAADQARRKHVFATTSTCVCGFRPATGEDWDTHLVRVAVDAAWPLAFAAGVAEGRRQTAAANDELRRVIKRVLSRHATIGTLCEADEFELNEAVKTATRIAEGTTDA